MIQTAERRQAAELNPVLADKSFQEAFQPYTIRLIAPASGTDPKKIEQLRTLSQLKIQVPENIMAESIVFHANSDAERLKQIIEALYKGSQHDIIWGLRGGYGSARLIQALSQLPKPKTEKIFIGFSDLTALHLFLSQHWHWNTIHGAGLTELLKPDQDPENLQRIAKIISKKGGVLKLSPLKPLNISAQNLKKISGRLTGGNLTIVQTSIGTSWQIDTTTKILFLEDRGQKGYQIDRTLHHLQTAGLLKHVRAIVFGEFSEVPDPEYVKLALERFAQELQIPVFETHQFGHNTQNYPLIYNAQSKISWNTKSNSFELEMSI